MSCLKHLPATNCPNALAKYFCFAASNMARKGPDVRLEIASGFRLAKVSDSGLSLGSQTLFVKNSQWFHVYKC